MEQILSNKLKRESSYIIICFIVLIIVFKILFFKENLTVIIRTVFSLFWLFILPGFMLMYYWHNKLDFIERLIMGSVLGLALIGVIGYNLGLIGINMLNQLWIVPLASIIAGIIIITILVKKSKKERTNP